MSRRGSTSCAACFSAPLSGYAHPAAVLPRRERGAVAAGRRLRAGGDRRDPAARRHDVRPRATAGTRQPRGATTTVTAPAGSSTPSRASRVRRALDLHRGARRARPAGSSASTRARSSGMFLAAVLAASLSSSVVVLVALYGAGPAGRPCQPRPVRLLREARLARHPVLRGARSSCPRSSWCPDRTCSSWPLGPVTIAPTVPGVTGARAVRQPGRRQRLAGGAAGDDDAVGRPAQEPAGGPRAAAVHPGPRDGVPLHLPVPAPRQRHVRGAQEPDRGADERRRAATLDHGIDGRPAQPEREDEQRRVRGDGRARLRRDPSGRSPTTA